MKGTGKGKWQILRICFGKKTRGGVKIWGTENGGTDIRPQVIEKKGPGKNETQQHHEFEGGKEFLTPGEFLD